ncbi:preprotein translocase subunit SecG [Geofilum rubicundum]|uniref:Protein-export membrane protein SecG n=1 Tax=Geofilum rubicundum JCM 15548 TaxID=1236989 RepID=A0A0E9LS05_9BACT|nr:preprotein translocase subunit SecG [Geofilum rubicundum]GAO28029.1 export membrane protein [Geofilum rubicundum JCM 15548]
MYPFVSVLVILVSIFLILIVLVQNSKGGGLASNFASSNQVMGVRKTTDFLEKATWTLATALLVLSFVAVMVLPKGEMGRRSVIDEQMENVMPPASNMPNFPIGDDAEEEGNPEEGNPEEGLENLDIEGLEIEE